MNLPGDFVSPTLTCQAPGFSFPGISQRGLPNILVGQLAANMAGINYLTPFLPPNPKKLPTLPGIDIFTQPSLGAINLPSAYPGVSVGPLTIPGVGHPPYAWDLSGEIKLIALGILLPFELISTIITGIINSLKVVLPTFATIQGLFMNIAAQLGLSGPAIGQLSGCVAQSIVQLFTTFIPV